MRSPERRNAISRRLGVHPGRRFVLAPALALVAAIGGAGSARADQIVVSATVYPASHGSVSTEAVTTSALGSCPLYTGTGQLTLYPSGQSLPLTSTTWSLATVISCGLHIPANDVNTVQVLNAFGKTVDTLSAADVTDPGLYHDPQAPGALPVISLNGPSGQATYARPWRGGADTNPTLTNTTITLLVYAYAPPLTVRASAHPHGADVTLSATVRTPDGTPVPASALRWSWSLGDGTTSIAATPVHRYAPGQSYSATVQVSDPGNGTGGTDSILVTPPAHPASGKQTHGGGHQHTKSRSPTGGAGRTGRETTTPSATATQPRGTQPAGTATQPTATQPTATQPAATATQPAATATQPTATATAPETTATQPAATATTPSTTPPTTPTPTTPRPTPRRKPEAKPGHARRPGPSTTPGQLVNGRLISDVIPLPAGASPLVRLAPAAAAPAGGVREATRAPALPIILGPLAVIALLGLGARRELRGRRRWRDVLLRR